MIPDCAAFQVKYFMSKDQVEKGSEFDNFTIHVPGAGGLNFERTEERMKEAEFLCNLLQKAFDRGCEYRSKEIIALIRQN